MIYDYQTLQEYKTKIQRNVSADYIRVGLKFTQTTKNEKILT